MINKCKNLRLFSILHHFYHFITQTDLFKEKKKIKRRQLTLIFDSPHFPCWDRKGVKKYYPFFRKGIYADLYKEPIILHELPFFIYSIYVQQEMKLRILEIFCLRIVQYGELGQRRVCFANLQVTSNLPPNKIVISDYIFFLLLVFILLWYE